MKNFSTQLSGQVGESLVVAELGRRGFVATSFAGNVPEIDMLAYKDGRSLPLQVKAQRSGSISAKADYFLNIRFDDDVQVVDGLNKKIDRGLIFVIIFLGDRMGEDRFYVCKQGAIQDIVFENHSHFLNKHDGIRPKQPRSTHCAYYEKDLINFRDNWTPIEELLKDQ